MPTIVAILVAALVASIPLAPNVTNAEEAVAPATVAEEIARIEGLSTFGELLARTNLPQMIDSMAAPRDSARMWLAIFAFTDEAWGLLRTIEAEDGRDATELLRDDPVALGELMRSHIAAFSPGQFFPEARRGPFPDDAPRFLREVMLDRGSVRTLDEGFLPVVANRERSARIIGSHMLGDRAIVVYEATRVRKAFLQAKKAFHTARQEIDGIKKGDEKPVADAVSFFDDEA